MEDQRDSYSINETEKKFKQFVEEMGTTAIFLHQSPSSFPKEFHDHEAKRPDFLIKTTFGDFYVDIKTSRLDKYPKFTIDIKNYQKLKSTQKLLKKKVFLAYPIDPWGFGEDWGFISISRVKKLKEKQQKWIEKGSNFIGIEYKLLKRFNELI